MFVVIEYASRRLLHANVTSHPTAAWTIQQRREAIPSDHSYRFLMHDRDSIFSRDLDQHIQNLGLKILKTPSKSSQAHAMCERIIGTVRRACLDFVIPFTATHVRRRLVEWVTHDNGGRPHMSLGPGIPQPSVSVPISLHKHRHWLRRLFLWYHVRSLAVYIMHTGLTRKRRDDRTSSWQRITKGTEL